MSRIQDLFNRVVRHTLTQGKQSMAPRSGKFGARCAYRGGDGLQCAIGCLIKDEFYRPKLDRGSSAGVYDSPVRIALEKSLGHNLEAQEMHMLAACQIVHDCREISAWRKEFRKVASTFNLKMPRLTKAKA